MGGHFPSKKNGKNAENHFKTNLFISILCEGGSSAGFKKIAKVRGEGSKGAQPVITSVF